MKYGAGTRKFLYVKMLQQVFDGLNLFRNKKFDFLTLKNKNTIRIRDRARKPTNVLDSIHSQHITLLRTHKSLQKCFPVCKKAT